MKIDIKHIPNNIIIAAAGIIVFTIFIGIVFTYIPFKNSSKELRFKILAEKDKNAIIAGINLSGKRLESYSKRTLDIKDPSWFLKEISRIASEVGIEASFVKSEDSEDTNLYAKLGVEINVHTTYHQLGVFLSRIESEEKFFKVESLSMKRLDLDDDFESLTERFKPFDVKANIIISTVILR